jgi:hypothetical protein
MVSWLFRERSGGRDVAAAVVQLRGETSAAFGTAQGRSLDLARHPPGNV